ncbi:hypothetical protein EJ377_16175 [Chryseobacterium arthrosphaerae]|uniref:Uncharacterized protein n=1 Tax=Chryseobacterium arthrosphaerae TaxID=651561 RepID=A0A432DSL8_9FLAO|nr:hypothetical protein EJ377_16175 [Chryseobacterium arthrosphaerae]
MRFESANAPINVVAANLSGSINPLSVVACVGSSPAITFIPSGAAPSGYIWMNGSQQVAGLQTLRLLFRPSPETTGRY